MSLTQELEFPSASVSVSSQGGALIELPNAGLGIEAGKPVLPVASAVFEIPKDCEVDSVSAKEADLYSLVLPAPVRWGEYPRVPDEAPPPQAAPDPAIATADALYPASAVGHFRTDSTDNGERLTVSLFPVRVNVSRSTVQGSRRLTVTVALKEKRAQARAVRLASATGSPLAERVCDYAIVAPSNLLDTVPGPYNFQALCAAREADGHTAALVSTEWISENYSGTNLAIRIRNFVQDAHRQWGLRYLLLGGTFDLVPVMKLYAKVYEYVSYRETAIPADGIYYGCLDGTMDGNGNGIYGEPTDGTGGKDIDLVAEVLVGRFPVANADELANMVRKTLAYESATPEQYRSNFFCGEKIDSSQNVYGSSYMEQIRLGSTKLSLSTMGFVNTSYAGLLDTATYYESDTQTVTQAAMLSFLNQNLHTVNHMGHGSAKFCMSINLNSPTAVAQLKSFTNAMPWVAYSEACLCGSFDTADCFAEQITTVSNAAVSAVMNAREGWYFSSDAGGPSLNFQRAFWDSAFRGRAATLGEMNNQSRLDCLPFVEAAYTIWRWVYFELTLFGDPATPLMPSINRTPAVVTHIPLVNTYIDDAAYAVDCSLSPIGLYVTDSVRLVWRDSDEPESVHTQRMVCVSGNAYTSSIPAHARGNVLSYAILADNRAGIETRYPSATNDCVFRVTEKLSLSIFGSPDSIGTPDPGYGTVYSASGLAITVSAPEQVYLNRDERFVLSGFIGSGSVPSSGANDCAFVIHKNSALFWLWEKQYKTVLCATNDLFAAQDFWTQENGTQSFPAVPAAISNETGWCRFSEWELDGARSPAAPSKCENPYSNLAVSRPHVLRALYLPESSDADGNGIADWYERMYYGAIGKDATADEDGDGFTLLEEFADWSSPLLATEFPAAPSIGMDILPDIVTTPAPYTVTASISDTHAVVAPALHWQLANSGSTAWETMPCLFTDDSYSATFGDADTLPPGSLVRYFITASDPSFATNATASHLFFVAYPRADFSLLADRETVALPTQSVFSATDYLINSGNRALTGTIRFSRQDTIATTNLPGWNWTSVEQPWAVSTNRFVSPPYSLHCKLDSSKRVKNMAPVHGSVTFPTCAVGPNAVFSFDYWIQGEVDKSNPLRAFDAGIVEYSLDGGTTFQQLDGPYTHTVYGWQASPWTDGTPCFSGDGSNGWQKAVFDLRGLYPDQNGFAGQNVLFRFNYGADNNTDYEGWYIDNVCLSPLDTAPEYSSEPAGTFSIAAGDLLNLGWFYYPRCMTVRDETVYVDFLTNDPVTPAFGFYWTLRVRDLPRIAFDAAQSANGDGLVTTRATFIDADSLPLSVSITGGTNHVWRGALGGLSMTNAVTNVWDTLAAMPGAVTHTGVWFRVSADNGFYAATNLFGPYTVDNEPPTFTNAFVWIAPAYVWNGTFKYYVSTNGDAPCSVLIPAATDFSGIAFYTGTAPGLETFPHPCDSNITIRITASDTFGNKTTQLDSMIFLNGQTDFDGDGMTTADEEIAGTSALDPSDCLRAALSLSGNAFILSWPTVPGKTYSVESSPSLAPAEWRPVATDLPASPFTFPIGTAPRGFYRLKVQ